MTAKMYQAKTNIATLLPNGQPNRVVGSLDGATMSMLQANSAMIADGSIVDADIAASAAIAKSKLAALGITDADIAAAAAIALSKLAPGASGLLKSNGSAISAGNQLAAGDVPLGLITSSMIADGTIADTDINASANIGLGKLAQSGTAYRVLATGASAPAAWQQIIANMIATNNVVASHIYPGGSGNAYTVLRTYDGLNSTFGKINMDDINLGAVVQVAGPSVGTNGAAINTTAWAEIPGTPFNMTTNGGVVLLFCVGSSWCNTAGAISQYILAWDGNGFGGFQAIQAYAASSYHGFTLIAAVQPSAGVSHRFAVWWSMNSNGPATFLSNCQMYAVEIKR